MSDGDGPGMRWAGRQHMMHGQKGAPSLQCSLGAPAPCRGTLGTLTTVAREEGVRSLWKGLVPGLHRQVLLGGVRIASCEPMGPWGGWVRGLPWVPCSAAALPHPL